MHTHSETVKRGPGRPVSGTAMTPAEKQRAYRERQKYKQQESGLLQQCDQQQVCIDQLEAQLQAALQERLVLQEQVNELKRSLDYANKLLFEQDVKLRDLKALNIGNVTEKDKELAMYKKLSANRLRDLQELQIRFDKQQIVLESNVRVNVTYFKKIEQLQEHVFSLEAQLYRLNHPKKRNVTKNKLAPDNTSGGYQQASFD